MDVLTLDDMEGFPGIRDESERNQLIMCAVACGLSQNFIASALGVTQPTINEIIKRIDPDGKFRISPKASKAFITQLYATRGIEALMSITPEKLQASSASELARVSKLMSDAAQNLNATKHREIGGNKMDLLLEQMAAEAVDVEFEVVNDA